MCDVCARVWRARVVAAVLAGGCRGLQRGSVRNTRLDRQRTLRTIIPGTSVVKLGLHASISNMPRNLTRFEICRDSVPAVWRPVRVHSIITRRRHSGTDPSRQRQSRMLQLLRQLTRLRLLPLHPPPTTIRLRLSRRGCSSSSPLSPATCIWSAPMRGVSSSTRGATARARR
jgi:hypothetical protein